jgi:hypothetical protein
LFLYLGNNESFFEFFIHDKITLSFFFIFDLLL